MNLKIFRKKMTFMLAAISCLLCILVPTATVFAVDVLENPCKDVPGSSLCESNKPSPPDGNNGPYGPDGILTKVADILATIVGIGAVIVITIGGIRYAISSGDSNNVNGAKNAILFALIGLAVALLAKAVVLFVLSKF